MREETMRRINALMHCMTDAQGERLLQAARDMMLDCVGSEKTDMLDCDDVYGTVTDCKGPYKD